MKERRKKKEMRMDDLKGENWEQFKLNRILVLLSVCECTLGFFQSSRQGEMAKRGRDELLTNKGKEFEKRGKRDRKGSEWWDEYKWKKGEKRKEVREKQKKVKAKRIQDKMSRTRTPGVKRTKTV